MTVGRRRIDLLEQLAPQPREGEVLVEVECVSVCGTDAHIWAGDYPSAPPPLIQGHEIAGRVDGGLVVIDPAVACGTCHACRIGRSNACAEMSVLGVHADGGLRETITVPKSRVHPVSDISSAVASLIEPASIALRAVHRSGAGAGTSALVLGAGPIGVLATLALTERHAQVAAVDRVEARTRTAGRFGAELTQHAVDAYPDETQRSEILDWTGGTGPSVVIEATGAPAALTAAFDLVAAGGTVVAVGISTGEARLPMSLLPYKELDVLGSRNGGAQFTEAVRFVGRHRRTVEELITHRFPLEHAQRAMGLAHDGAPDLGKILITVGDR